MSQQYARQGGGTEKRWRWALLTRLLSSGCLQDGQFLYHDDADSGCSYSTVEVDGPLLRLRWVQVREGREASGKGDPEVGCEGWVEGCLAEAERPCPAFHSLPVLSHRPCVFLLFLKTDQEKTQSLFFFLFPNCYRLVVSKSQIN